VTLTAPRPGHRRRPPLPVPPDRVHVPRHMRAPELEPNRVTISADLLRYARRVHQADEHAGQLGRDCRTCKRYAVGIIDATSAEHERNDSGAFELPASAANAYATALRPHVGGLA